MNLNHSAVVVVLAAAVLMLAACGAGAKTDTAPAAMPAPTPAPTSAAAAPINSPLASPLNSPVPAAPAPDALKVGMAGIDAVTLRVEASQPPKLIAHVKGYLGDSCTSLGAVSQQRAGDTIKVLVGTLRPADRMCAQVVKDFEVDVQIQTEDLTPGKYFVDVNGAGASFEIDATGPKAP